MVSGGRGRLHCLSRDESRQAFKRLISGELTDYRVVRTSPEPLQLQLPEASCGFENFTLPLLSPSLPQAAKKHAPCHFYILSDMNACLILDGMRIRKPSPQAAAIAIVMNNPCLIIARAFAQALTNSPSTHQDDSTELPLEPTSHKKAMIHKYNNAWILAEEEKYKAHNLNGTWTELVTMLVDIFALPTKWVYKYKFNESGKLTRPESRLVVNGNCQDIDFWCTMYAVLKGEREYEVKRLIDCRLKGEARPDYILSLSTGKLRPSPPPSNTPPQTTNKPNEMQQCESNPSTPPDYILHLASLNSPNPTGKMEEENQQCVSVSMSMSLSV
jgi:hypothetical protein